MFSKILTTLVAFLHLISPILSVDVGAYLGNACNGDNLYDITAVDGECWSLSGIEVADSFTVTGFASGEVVNFYSDSGCTSLVGTASTDVCFLVPQAGVQSLGALA